MRQMQGKGDGMSEDTVNARKARYLTIVELVKNNVIDETAAKDCLKGNLDPDDDNTFSNDSMLPLDNKVQAMYMIELSEFFIEFGDVRSDDL